MVVVLEQPELLLEDEGAAGRVDDPVGLVVTVVAVTRRRRDLVAVVAELDVLDEAAAEVIDPGFDALLGQEVLEAAAVELVAGHGRMLVRAALDALGEVAVVARGEPEAQAALVDLLLLQVVLAARAPRRSSGRTISWVDSPTL